jgi:hypothetical protein
MANNNFFNNDYYRHPLDPNQIKSAVTIVTTKIYLNKLIKLQTLSTLILLSSIVLQVTAIATNDWFVLNVNEYVQTAKGGLWYYCTLSGGVVKIECTLYEKLPNYFVWATDRLYDSRTLLLCSSGFLLIMIIIEISGIICLRMSEKRGCDPCAKLVSSRSGTFQILNNDDDDPKRQVQTSTPTLKSYKQSSLPPNHENRGYESVSIRPEFNLKRRNKPIKPIGYFAFLAISLLTMVGSVMEFILKVSGFALFDNYITRLLAKNQVFVAYRSWSYWLMAGSILFILIFWIFKVLATRHVVTLTRTVVLQDAAFSAFACIDNSNKNKKNINTQNDKQLFSIQNSYNIQDIQSQREAIIRSKKPEIARVKYTNKNSQDFSNGLVFNNPHRPSFLNSSLRTSIPTYTLDIYNENDDESENTITESVMNDIMANGRGSQLVVNYPAYPYIYRF